MGPVTCYVTGIFELKTTDNILLSRLWNLMPLSSVFRPMI